MTTWIQEAILGGNHYGHVEKDDTLIPLDEAVKSLPGAVWWKNHQGVYLGVNEGTIRVVGSKVQIGRKDKELPWKNYATEWVENDQKVMDVENTLLFDESGVMPNGDRYVARSIKAPLYDKNGNIIGTVGESIDLTEFSKLKGILHSENKGQDSFQQIPQHFSLENLRKTFPSLNKKYLIKTKIGTTALLSERQMQCIYCLAHGYTLKETASIMSISPRTVETHINFTKTKLGYYSRSQLVELMSENILIATS